MEVAPLLSLTELDKLTREELVTVARELFVLRPLAPFPGWRFDAGWDSPEPVVQLRRKIWSLCSVLPESACLDVGWHRDTKLRLWLGNDISKQLFVTGTIDPNELALLNRILEPGMTFVYAGANEGIYTVFAGACVGPGGAVWAFEPSSRERAHLDVNVALNQLSNVRMFPVALADADGAALLKVSASNHAGLNTLGTITCGVSQVTIEIVPVRTLDGLADEVSLARLDVLKVDVEGAELRLLRGAACSIERFRPMVMFETNQSGSLGELLDWFRGQEYSLFVFDPASGLPVPEQAAAMGDNVLAVPAGRQVPS